MSRYKIPLQIFPEIFSIRFQNVAAFACHLKYMDKEIGKRFRTFKKKMED